jgi:hypothetical protein
MVEVVVVNFVVSLWNNLEQQLPASEVRGAGMWGLADLVFNFSVTRLASPAENTSKPQILQTSPEDTVPFA